MRIKILCIFELFADSVDLFEDFVGSFCVFFEFIFSLFRIVYNVFLFFRFLYNCFTVTVSMKVIFYDQTGFVVARVLLRVYVSLGCG